MKTRSIIALQISTRGRMCSFKWKSKIYYLLFDLHNRDNPKKLPTVKKIDDVTTT